MTRASADAQQEPQRAGHRVEEGRHTNQRLDQTSERLDERFDLLARRLTESELRTATALTALAATLGDIKELLADRLDLHDRVGTCEKDIIRIKGHVGIG